MKKIEILNQDIKLLNLNNTIIQKLSSINICKIEDLWKCTRKYLKESNFTNNDITEIKIKLQLLGLDLNKKVY